MCGIVGYVGPRKVQAAAAGRVSRNSNIAAMTAPGSRCSTAVGSTPCARSATSARCAAAIDGREAPRPGRARPAPVALAERPERRRPGSVTPGGRRTAG